MNKLTQILSHPLTEVALRAVAGTVFTKKSVQHFRKGNVVRGTLFGVGGASNIVKLINCLTDKKEDK